MDRIKLCIALSVVVHLLFSCCSFLLIIMTSSPLDLNPSGSQATARQTQYFDLIDQLLRCPSGQEPDVLDAHADLLDEGLIRSMVQVASYFAHENNSDAAQFLAHVARELAKQLGFYPNPSDQSAT